MQNIRIKNMNRYEDIDRKIMLNNGSLILHKKNDKVIGIYLVTSYRGNKNKYPSESTNKYCSLIDLETGKIAFEERCSRATTERRVLKHLTHVGYTSYYEAKNESNDIRYKDMRVSVYKTGNYTMDIELGEELSIRKNEERK